jgi:hypothetical protein
MISINVSKLTPLAKFWGILAFDERLTIFWAISSLPVMQRIPRCIGCLE